MKMFDLSRREFVHAAAATLLPIGRPRNTQTQPDVTAQQIVDRIRSNVGVPWRDKSMDGIKTGDPSTIVTGIATTAMATLPVLRRASAAGHNFIVTQEPTFYSPNDEPGNRNQDPVYLAKKAFIDQHHLVIFRLNDHWNARQTSESASASTSAAALAEALLWNGLRAPGNDDIYNIPEMTFGALMRHIRSRLVIRGGLRSIGRPDMRVRTVLLSPGTTDLATTIARLPRVDVIIAGEPREWEVVPYVLDTRTAGQDKAMIALGRIVSEEPGMRACAAWIKTFTPEVRVETITIGDPHWSPAS
jgi:putative NIF3 family GTP cyclohydrolase 1 type 2